MFHHDRPSVSPPHWPRVMEAYEPPHFHGGASVRGTYATFCAACAPPMIASAVIFGYGVLFIFAWAVLGALAAARLCRRVTGPRPPDPLAHTVSVGLILSLTLPPTAPWWLAFLGGLASVAVGRHVLGGLGNYLWHPALVGRVILGLFFADALYPTSWPFLGRGRLLSGSLEAAARTGDLGFRLSEPPLGFDAWSLARPIDTLMLHHGTPRGAGSEHVSLLGLFRDGLPPWSDTVWGVVGGGIGETCTLALIAGALILVYRRHLRWQLPATALLAVGVLAAVWPIPLDGPAGAAAVCPIPAVRDGLWLGAAAVLFHLTGGGLLLACLLVAPDPVSSPLTGRGHAWFGLGLGVLTFVGRVTGLSAGAEYWAVLGMNTLVPLIDRMTHRRAYGA